MENSANAVEIRFNTIKEDLESRLGSNKLRSNGRYKRECRRASNKALGKNGRRTNNRGREILREIYDRSCALYNVTPQQVGIYQ